MAIDISSMVAREINYSMQYTRNLLPLNENFNAKVIKACISFLSEFASSDLNYIKK